MGADKVNILQGGVDRQYLRLILDTISDGAILLDPQLNITYVNPKICFLLGCSPSDLLGRAFFSLIPADIVAQKKQKALRSPLNKPQKFDIVLTNRNNRAFPCVVTAVPTHNDEDNSQEILLLVCINSSQNEKESKVNSEVALRSSEERFRSLFEDSPIALWEEDYSAVKQRLDILRAHGVTDFSTYFESHPEAVAECGRLIKILNVNNAAVKLFHAKNKAEILSESALIFGGKEYPFFATELLAVAEGKTNFEWEGVNYTLDGDPLILNLQWSAAPSFEHNLERVFVSTVDVTGRRQAENQLREKERQLSTLMANLPGMVYRCKSDKDWTMEFISEGSLALTGYLPEEFIHNQVSYNDLVYQEDRAFIHSEIEKASNLDVPFQISYRIRTKTGQIKWVWEQGRRIPCDSKMDTLEGFIIDITEQWQAEQSLTRISEAQKLMTQLHDPKEIVQLIGKSISALIDDAMISVTIPDKKSQTVRFAGHYGFGDLFEKISEQFNFDPSAISFSMKDYSAEESTMFCSDKLEKFENGLYGLLARNISKTVCRAIEKQLHLTGIYIMGFVRNGIHYGDLVVLTRSDISPYVGTIETIVNQASILISRIYSERDLSESEERFRGIFEESPIGIILTDSERKFILTNPALSRLLGYSPEELRNFTFEDITHPEDRGNSEILIDQLSSGAIPFFVLQKRYLHKEGKTVWANVTVTIIHSQSGQIANHLIMIEDITEKKKTEEAFQYEQYLMQTLMDNIPDSVYFKDLESHFIRVNRATVAKFGLHSADELLGKVDVDFFPQADGEESLREEQGIIRTGNPIINQEAIEIWKDQRPVTWASITKMALPDKTGKIIGTFGVTRDITDRKAKEEEIKRLNADLEKRVEIRTKELKLRNQELESFAYSISHDLKAPLRGITGYSQLLIQEHSGQLDDEGKSFLNKLVLSSTQLSELIDDLFVYSSMERKPINRVELYVSDIISAVIEERMADISQSNILLHQNIEIEKIVSSPELLTQIFRNYLDNAIKFSKTIKQPEIWLDYKNQGDTSLFVIRDNGIGFDMKHREKIFDVFYRLQRNDEYPGTGIGLALVKKAADILGYQVWVESKEGAGAEFFLEISKKKLERI